MMAHYDEFEDAMVDVCSKCGGDGVIDCDNDYPSSQGYFDEDVCTCPVCMGTGQEVNP